MSAYAGVSGVDEDLAADVSMHSRAALSKGEVGKVRMGMTWAWRTHVELHR